MAQPLIIALSSAGSALAEEIAAALGLSVTDGKVIESLQEAYGGGRPIIAIGASGIVIRALSPCVSDKFNEPPVLCVSPEKAVIVLLGGHHGGNRLARQVAETIGGQAIISTASEFGEYLENPPPGWRVNNARDAAKNIMAKSLKGEKIKLYDPYGLSFLPQEFTINVEQAKSADIIISDKHSDRREEAFVLHPPLLVLGVGCERNAPADIMIKEIRNLLEQLDLSEFSIAAIGSVSLKCDEAALHALAENLGCPLRFFTAETLHGYDSQLPNPSDAVMAEIGCRGVAEGAVLALMNSAGEFIAEKQKHGRFTTAIGRVAQPLTELIGERVGRLDIVGIGPGDSSQRTESVTRALAAADAVVGYGLYLDLCADVIGDKKRHDYQLGEERERCLKALQLAAAGDNIALVCSGDAGIYALASIVYNVLAEEGERALNAVKIDIHPGISAFQLLAARSGAPFGDDFCLISLSDLWVEEAQVKRRIQAAIDGDFAIGFYNPQSRTRRELLPYAVKKIMEKRGGDVPLMFGRNLGRPREEVKLMALKDFDTEKADMMTMLMIGNSRTKLLELKGELKAYSPRILSKKRQAS